VTPTPTTVCDPNATKSAARSAFSSSQDIGISLAGDLAKAFQGADYATANAKAWAILEDLAAERLTAAAPNALNNGVLAVDVLRCVSDLSSGTPPAQVTIPQAFLDNATLILSSGIFDVRGGAAVNSGPALGKVTDASSHLRAFGAPRWGVEAVDGTTWFGTQHLVFGYPTLVGLPILGSKSIDGNDILGGTYNAFELSSVPTETSHSGLRVGACVKQNLTSGDGTVNRLVHNNNEILINSAPLFMCDPSLQALLPSSSWFASAAQRVAAFFSVSNAYADDDFIGGLPSGWSPFEYGPVNAGNIVLSSIIAPANTTVSTAPQDSVVVFAGVPNPDPTKASVGVPGVTVTISIVGNSGQSAGATFDNGLTTKSGVTDANGRVTIKYGIGKAGGYTINTTGTFDGNNPVGNVLSTFINVKNP
jgi:hypothetical protein